MLDDPDLKWIVRGSRQKLTEGDCRKIVRFNSKNKTRYAIIDKIDPEVGSHHCVRQIWKHENENGYCASSHTNWWTYVRDKRYKYYILDDEDAIIIKLALNI